MNDNRVRGFITRERWLLGKTPREMARLLGFHESRMARGAKFYSLLVLPSNDQFEFAGHTHWPGGTPIGGGVDLWPEAHARIDRQWMPDPETRAKNNVRLSWRLTGPERLIKVVTHVLHDVNMESLVQYPPGAGVEQWKLLVELPAVSVADLGPDDRYRP